MQPSSLVLVAIVGMWAAYLVPSWIRRGESRLARRQADRVAEDARVLEPRPAPEAESEGPSTAPLLKRPGGPVVTASVPDTAASASVEAHPAHGFAAQGRSLAELMHDPHRAIGDDAQVRRVEAGTIEPDAGARILRRARAELPPDSRSPEAAPARRPPVRGGAESVRRPAGASSSPDLGEPSERPARRPAPPADRRPAPAADRRPERSSSAAAVAGPHTSAAARAVRRRARLLLALVLAAVASWAVVGLAHLSVLAAVPASVLLGLDLVLLVATAPARARRRRAVTPARRPAPPRRERAETPTAAQGRRRTATVYDVDGVPVRETADVEPAPQRVTQPDDGTWIPVPVPPPTYTMKPVVHRHEPLIIEPIETLPAAEAGVSLGAPAAAPVAAELDDQVDAGDVTFDLEAVLARRRAVNG